MGLYDEDGKNSEPYSIEAEEALLGSVFINPNVMGDVVDIITAEDFYKSNYKLIFSEMINAYNSGKIIDVLLIIEALKKKELMDEVGDEEVIYDLTEVVPTAANAVNYAQIIKDKSVQRQLITIGEKIVRMATRGYEETDAMLDKSESMIFKIAESKQKKEIVKLSELVQSKVKRLDDGSEAKGKITGISSGFSRYDSITSGFHGSDLIILAARPAMGKTAFVLNVATHVALQGGTVAFFSLEMPREQLMHRIFCAEGQIDATRLARGELDDEEWERLVKVADRIMKTKLYFDDTSSTTVLDIRTRARRLKAEHGLDLIAIDYLQLIQAPGRAENRTLAVAEMTRSLKVLARELNVPIIVLSQLSRATEGRSDKRPMLSDLRESGSIEQDADIVMFLYREDYYNQDTENANITELSIAKHRNGATDTVRMYFQKEYTRFRDLAHE